MRNSLVISVISSLLVSGVAFAANTNYALIVNDDSVKNGSYKTVNYRICSNDQQTSQPVCGSPKSIDVRDAVETNRGIAKIDLKDGEFIEVASAVEKNSVGATLAQGNYLLKGMEQQGLSNCEGDAHLVTKLGNFAVDENESFVTCDSHTYR
jgi:hypothetical protein